MSDDTKYRPGRPPHDAVNGLRVGAVAGGALGVVAVWLLSLNSIWLVFVSAVIGGALGYFGERRKSRL